jgi:hypothetical protein
MLCRTMSVSCSLICLSCWAIWIYWGSHCLCLYVPVYPLLFFALISKFQVIYSGPSSTVSWYLYRVKDRDLVSVFYM